MYRNNRDDGEDIEIFDYIKTKGSRKSKYSSSSNEEQIYKKTYTAPCSSTCAQAITLYPTYHGGTYNTPVELRNNCHRIFRGFNIGYRRCQAEEVVQPTIIQEREVEKTTPIWRC